MKIRRIGKSCYVITIPKSLVDIFGLSGKRYSITLKDEGKTIILEED